RISLLLGLVTSLAACASESSPPAAKVPPPISAEVAAAPGRVYLNDGRVEPADRWWESGEILFYEWKDEMHHVLRNQVARIEGAPRPKGMVVGAAVSAAPVSWPPTALAELQRLKGEEARTHEYL